MSDMQTVSSIDLSSPDGMDAYLRFVYKQPMLSVEEEVNLANLHIKNNDLKAAEKLILSHLKLVASLSRSFFGYGISQSDLIQEGTVGLMKAVKKYDPTVGVRLSTFATHFIRSEIFEYSLRNWNIVRVATTKAQRKLFFNLRKLNGPEGLSNKEIAKELDVSEKDVEEMTMRLKRPAINFNSIGVESDYDTSILCPEEYIHDLTYEPFTNIISKNRERLFSEGIKSAIQNLDSREREIIESRWLTETPETLQDLGERFSISLERVRQIEKKALGKMKKQLPEHLVECLAN